MLKIEIHGVFTSGYYNEMEAGYPVFIDGDPIDDLIKDELKKRGLSSNFCDEGDVVNDTDVLWKLSTNTLIGKKVKVTIEVEE